MAVSNPVDEQRASWSSALRYSLIIVVQAVLFLAASAAITLFYLFYRFANFPHAFIVIGLLLLGPWLIISLLPTLFGIEDKELRREILTSQLLFASIVLAILIGLAIYLGFHQVIWDRISAFFLTSASYLNEIWQNLKSHIGQGVKSLSAFVDTILSRFSSG